jgi:hypothetical protein
MGFKEKYQSITLSQYLYNAPFLSSTCTKAKQEMEKRQKRFFKIIGIISEQVLQGYKLEPITTYLENPEKY